jgi:GNAT superfamily N-acetyltransferase
MADRRSSVSRARTRSVDLRAATAQDMAFSFRVTEDAMRGYVELTWGAWQPVVQRHAHDAAFRADTHTVVMVDGLPAGIVAGEALLTHLQLHKLFLLSGFRNRGVGSQLLRHLLDAAALARLPVRLRVLAVNQSAQRFYARHGFVVARATPERVYMQAVPALAARTVSPA